jgi:hypothetical protein
MQKRGWVSRFLEVSQRQFPAIDHAPQVHPKIVFVQQLEAGAIALQNVIAMRVEGIASKAIAGFPQRIPNTLTYLLRRIDGEGSRDDFGRSRVLVGDQSKDTLNDNSSLARASTGSHQHWPLDVFDRAKLRRIEFRSVASHAFLDYGLSDQAKARRSTSFLWKSSLRMAGDQRNRNHCGSFCAKDIRTQPGWHPAMLGEKSGFTLRPTAFRADGKSHGRATGVQQLRKWLVRLGFHQDEAPGHWTMRYGGSQRNSLFDDRWDVAS